MSQVMKRYLLFASHSYAYQIFRPLQREILRRGDECAWFLEDSCPDMLLEGETRIRGISEVIDWNPTAVFACGNWVYDFFPGVKVELFHGYPMNKRNDAIDDHFSIRGWFDIYCTQGPSSTPYFKKLSEKHRYFKIYETGWPKIDDMVEAMKTPEPVRNQLTILYAPTFTKGISSAWDMIDPLRQMVAEKPWNWIITFHPKLDDPWLIEQYQQLDREFANIEFRRFNKGMETFRDSDLMLCDSSAIIVEYLMLDKPVVTLRNTIPGPHLVNVENVEDIPDAIEYASTKPSELMKGMHEYTAYHEAHRDGQNSARVLDAVDHFIANYKGRLPHKPLNLLRKFKVRMRLGYWKK